MCQLSFCDKTSQSSYCIYTFDTTLHFKYVKFEIAIDKTRTKKSNIVFNTTIILRRFKSEIYELTENNKCKFFARLESP